MKRVRVESRVFFHKIGRHGLNVLESNWGSLALPFEIQSQMLSTGVKLRTDRSARSKWRK